MQTEYKIDRTRPDTNVFVLNLFFVLSRHLLQALFYLLRPCSRVNSVSSVAKSSIFKE
jgi:hypothetical protein